MFVVSLPGYILVKKNIAAKSWRSTAVAVGRRARAGTHKLVLAGFYAVTALGIGKGCCDKGRGLKSDWRGGDCK